MPYTGTCPFTKAVESNPRTAAAWLTGLAVLSLILAAAAWHYRSRGGAAGFTPGGCAARPCAPGVCRPMWDPAASAEAQGLATVQAANFEHSGQAEAKLMSVLNAATS